LQYITEAHWDNTEDAENYRPEYMDRHSL